MTEEHADVVTMIRTQHETIRELFNEVDTAPPDGRRDSFEELVRLLAVHETAEEEVVYPVVRKANEDAPGIVEQRTAEEDAAKKALADLEGKDLQSAEFATAFAKFRRDVERHAAREEQLVLPLLEQNDPESLLTMGKVFAVAEKMAPTHAHRMAPESALGNMLVGPFVAMVDKVRDAIRDARRDDN